MKVHEKLLAVNSLEFFRMEDNFNFDKPYKTSTQLIEILKSRNLVINNDSLAIDLLSSYGYYPCLLYTSPSPRD